MTILKETFCHCKRKFFNYFIKVILKGYFGVSLVLTFIAFIIGKIKYANAIEMIQRTPNPNNKINGIQIIKYINIDILKFKIAFP